MKQQSFVQAATENLTNTSKSVVSDALDVATGMAAVEVIKQLAFSVMPVKVGFVGPYLCLVKANLGAVRVMPSWTFLFY